MKIDLKLNKETLIVVSNLLQELYCLENTSNPKQKIYRSIGFDLAEKFEVKAKGLIKKNSLFDLNKKVNMSLKFHEAWALEIILNELCVMLDNHYNQIVVNLIISELNQKLT
ncbi:hypothetical protein [Flavobacterium sp. HSC-61S13]|uniref:hypothetical protein n=1 Tax=Flavobacterium sp. HSC-61S13 TaxID=2910963 RepID=UPI0020A1B949|nr:hypothetical protein [Flavobacterium sp. HSC-61S13]MCP1997280.1 hypothetical protein [Flavobacterium sp. HSC-61S13]